jgi:hypothetical protein
MTTKELWAKVRADGIAHVLERYHGEPTDNPRLARLWDAAYARWKAVDDAMGELEREIEAEATRP